MGAALWDALTAPRSHVETRTFDGHRFHAGTWDELRSRAAEISDALRRRGVGEGVPVACILTNTFDVAASLLGVWGAGATVVSLPTIARGMTVPDYAARIGGLCADAACPFVLVEGRFAPILAATERLQLPIVSYESLRGSSSTDLSFPAEDDVVFVQYSSGSTHEPLGCMLTARAIAAQLELLRDALALDPERDRGMMWLPLSHDMGLFGGLLLCWTAGIPGMLGTPERFLARPRTWLDDCVSFGATITAAPSSAVGMAIRAARLRPPAGALSLRACVVGGERIEWSTIELAVAELGRHGFSLDSITPAYGLAEATLAVSVGVPGQRPRVAWAQAGELAGGRFVTAPRGTEGSVAVVSVGRPLSGVDVRIEAEDGVGEIRVRTPSAAAGYANDPAATGRTFVEGEVRTGDLGFLEGGELFFTGRADDLLVVGGRNVYARDVEAVAANTGAIKPGNCVVVDVPGTAGTALALVAELANGADDPRRVAAVLAREAVRATGIVLDQCVFMEHGMLPKTPSGKPQRFRCRQIVLEGGAERARVRM